MQEDAELESITEGTEEEDLADLHRRGFDEQQLVGELQRDPQASRVGVRVGSTR